MGGRLWVPVASGPLAPYAVGYSSWLLERGYSRWTVSHRLWQLKLLSRRLTARGWQLMSWRQSGWSGSWRRGGCGLCVVVVGARHGVAARISARAGGCADGGACGR